MGSTGGVHSHHSTGAQLPPGAVGKDIQQQQGLEKSAAVGRGFSTSNSVSHREGRRLALGLASERTIRLPRPTVDHTKLASPELQAQISQQGVTTELMFTFDELLNQLSAEEGDEGSGEESSLGDSLFATPVRKTKGQGQQGGDGMGRNPGGQPDNPLLDAIQGDSALVQAAAKDPARLLTMHNEALGVMEKIAAIESAPPEVITDLKAAGDRLSRALLNGDVEDVARILSEVQTQLQDTRIKFDEQAIRTSRLKREQVHQERIGKLAEAIEKMKEADRAGIFGKVFSAIATALAVVVAAITIATGVGAKAGVMLIMAATIMVAMTISQNTGDWMTNMFGLIKDDNVQLVIGLAWAILAAALSLGAGIAGGASKAAADTTTTTVQQTANATSQAAQQSANAAAQAAQQSVTTASQTAQQTAQQTATAVQETAKQTAKAAADAADEVAEQAAKVAVKSAQKAAEEVAKETAKTTAENVVKETAKATAENVAKETAKATAENVAKETAKTTVENTAKETAKTTAENVSKETAKQMSEISKKTLYFKRAAHIARFTEGGSQLADGGSQFYAAGVRYEGEMYQADAQEDLAFITKMQMQMEDWMEAIQRALDEIGEGEKIASDMLAQAQQNKFKLSGNI